MFVHEIDRLNGSTDRIDVELGFVRRERIPERIADVGIQLRLVVLSLSNTKQYLENLGVERSYNRVRKAELQPTSDATPDHVAVDETVIRVNDERRRLYTAIDQEERISARSAPCDQKNAAYGVVLGELRRIVPVTHAAILADDAHHLRPALSRLECRFRMSRQGNRSAVERVIREVKHHTSSLLYTFGRAQ